MINESQMVINELNSIQTLFLELKEDSFLSNYILIEDLFNSIMNVIMQDYVGIINQTNAKQLFGKFFNQTIELAKKSASFNKIIDRLETHVAKIGVWLGPDWNHILNLLRSKELGQKFPITVVKYDPIWISLYEDEIAYITSLIPPQFFLRTEHFGSTAIPGLSAKPIIDILVEIPNFTQVQKEIVPLLEKVGYIYSWQSGHPPGHIMLVKGYFIEGAQKFHYHMAPVDHPLWDRIYFRDYLQLFPEIAKHYESLKLELAEKFHFDREAYTNGKTEFVVSVTNKARQYFQKLYTHGDLADKTL